MSQKITAIQKCAWGFAALFLGVYLLDYVPGIMEANGLMFGLFHMTRIVDLGHLGAGNDVVVVTAIIQQWNQETPEERVLFFEPFLTRPSVKRVALECRVHDLRLVLNDLANRGIPVEHVYDY
jgi:hypothetical protein